MARDPQYRADAVKADLPVGAAIDGAELAAKIQELAGAATPNVIAAYGKLATRKWAFGCIRAGWQYHATAGARAAWPVAPERP
jgi:hypothetical protein